MLYQVLGLSAGLCGTVFLIAAIVDAISDPIVGALSDSVSTRWGRRHPYVPGDLPTWFVFLLNLPTAVWLVRDAAFHLVTVTLVGMQLAKSFYAVPHAALGGLVARKR